MPRIGGEVWKNNPKTFCVDRLFLVRALGAVAGK